MASVAGPVVLPKSVATSAAHGWMHGNAAQPSLPRKRDVGVPRRSFVVVQSLKVSREGMIWGLRWFKSEG